MDLDYINSAALIRPRSYSFQIEREMRKEDMILNSIFSFNANPSVGIRSLCRLWNLEETPMNIAHILRHQTGLVSSKVASYLSKNSFIMHEYFNTFNLKKPFIEALRLAFSGNLVLQGEAEFIDKELSTFAQVYCLQNPDTFTSVDSAYMLAFAATLLHSDLHNPQVKNHMTMQQFISNIRGVISESALSNNILSEIYKDVKNKPFTSQNSDDILAMSDPRLKGYLSKRNDKWNSTWCNRFFVLANSCLYYFRDNKPENKEKPLGMLQLVDVEAYPDPKNNKRFYIEAKDKGDIMYVKFKDKGPFLLKGIKRAIFETKSEETRDKWLYRITKSLICSMFTDGNSPTSPPSNSISEVGTSSESQTTENSLENHQIDTLIAELSSGNSGQLKLSPQRSRDNIKISKFIGQDETIELAEDNQKNSLILRTPSLDTGECARISNDLSSNIQNKDQNNTSIEKIEVHSDKIKKGSKTYHAFSPDNKTKNPECKNENYVPQGQYKTSESPSNKDSSRNQDVPSDVEIHQSSDQEKSNENQNSPENISEKNTD